MNSLVSRNPLDRPVPQRAFWLVLLIYGVLVLGMWGVFAFDRGLTHETVFVERCQNSLQACLMLPSDPLRPFNSLYLGLAYLLGGGNGSYLSYQLLYGALWWGRGVLTYLIFARICPNHPLVGVLTGALVITHISDGNLNFIPQLHQVGFLFMLALAVYCLVEFWLCSQRWPSLAWVTASLVALYVSLWSYESHYILILSLPLLLYALRPKLDRRLIQTTLIWYALPLLYGGLQLIRYGVQKQATYQTSMLRQDWGLGPILSDLGVHLWRTFSFWKWNERMPAYTGWDSWSPVASPFPLEQLGWAVAVPCAIAFGLGIYLMARRQVPLTLPSQRWLWVGLAFGGLWLLLSFPVYLLMRNNTNFLRSQMLSSYGAAIVTVLLLLLLAQWLLTGRATRYRGWFAVAACSVIVLAGVRAGVISQLLIGQQWQAHQQVMTQLVQIAPNVKPNTIILMLDVPRGYGMDPFQELIWFDQPLRVLYRSRQVAGDFLYANGHPTRGSAWEFTANGLRWDSQKAAWTPGISQAPYDHLVVLRLQPNGRLRLLEQFPSEILPQPFDTSGYAPHDRILHQLGSDFTIRMFAR